MVWSSARKYRSVLLLGFRQAQTWIFFCPSFSGDRLRNPSRRWRVSKESRHYSYGSSSLCQRHVSLFASCLCFLVIWWKRWRLKNGIRRCAAHIFLSLLCSVILGDNSDTRYLSNTIICWLMWWFPLVLQGSCPRNWSDGVRDLRSPSRRSRCHHGGNRGGSSVRLGAWAKPKMFCLISEAWFLFFCHFCFYAPHPRSRMHNGRHSSARHDQSQVAFTSPKQDAFDRSQLSRDHRTRRLQNWYYARTYPRKGEHRYRLQV